MIVNIGCGSARPGPPWVNVDTLYEYLGPGGQWERAGSADAMESIRRLREEPNYQNWDCRNPWPLHAESADGVYMSHVLEHLDCQECLKTLRVARRVLKPKGVIRVGVPDPAVFRMNFAEDTAENTKRLFGEGEALWPGGPSTFTEGALFFKEHKQALGEDALWCCLAVAGFRSVTPQKFRQTKDPRLCELDNREKFTLFMEGVK